VGDARPCLLMSENKPLSPRGRTYVIGVIVAGMIAVAASFNDMLAHPVGYQWFILAALTVISGSATVRLPSIPASLSVSETFVFTSVLMFGASAGTLTVALDGLIISFWLSGPRKEVHRVLFNMAAPALSIWVASQLFFYLAGIRPLSQNAAAIQDFLLPLLVFTVLYFGLNSWLIAFAVALETSSSPLLIWRNNFVWLSLNFLCGASVAALLTAYTRKVELAYLGAILPLLFVLYMTYRTSMARVEDANKHLQQVNTLYLSTIETLAMAIDAKDQVTHGHIRRVQAYATGLARALGVSDPATLHAVEAASLLHDMGKLAIPEHILNKPGRLTASEFEKMKLHAAIGADILSAIHFPYPVVPIVRHHHESWDGTGYPDGLSGIDIPIGARILSVVDCFDALTSDRPYRPALKDGEAIKILLDRRGSMYDPLIVDTFIRVHADIGPDPVGVHPPQVIADIAKGISTLRVDTAPQVAVASRDHSERLLIFSSLLTNVPGQIGSGDIAELSWYHLRQMVPVTALALYGYDNVADEIVALALIGPTGPVQFRGRTAVGQGLSGWVAASRQPILNSDPRLDLGGAIADLPADLSSAASLPLTLDDQLVGVLTIYSDQVAAYTDQHLKLLNVLAPRLAHALSRSRRFDEETVAHLWDSETGLPNDRYLQEYLSSPVTRGVGSTGSILLIRANEATTSSPGSANRGLKTVADAVRSSLRLGDLVFRMRSDEILCILHGADATTANLVRLRVSEALDGRANGLREASDIELSIATATPPVDGPGLDELVVTARRQLVPLNSGLIAHQRSS
jgi:putative nucleotidyltransferase with HDIG domain